MIETLVSKILKLAPSPDHRKKKTTPHTHFVWERDTGGEERRTRGKGGGGGGVEEEG